MELNGMYNRYGDMSKFVTDPDLLEIARDNTVCISGENDYDIVVDLEDCSIPFDEMRPLIADIAARIFQLDNIVQRFYQKKRIKRRGYVCLPSSVGILLLDYGQSVEDNPAPQKDFPYFLNSVCIEKPDFITLDYWHFTVNADLSVVFERGEAGFRLRRYGAVDRIPDDWEAD